MRVAITSKDIPKVRPNNGGLNPEKVNEGGSNMLDTLEVKRLAAFGPDYVRYAPTPGEDGYYKYPLRARVLIIATLAALAWAVVLFPLWLVGVI
jgi:hypothetical protein